jgi:hypothetical protein
VYAQAADGHGKTVDGDWGRSSGGRGRGGGDWGRDGSGGGSGRGDSGALGAATHDVASRRSAEEKAADKEKGAAKGAQTALVGRKAANCTPVRASTSRLLALGLGGPRTWNGMLQWNRNLLASLE